MQNLSRSQKGFIYKIKYSKHLLSKPFNPFFVIEIFFTVIVNISNKVCATNLAYYTLNCFTYPLTTLVLIVNVFVLIVHKSIAIFQLSITNIFSTMYDRVQKKNLRVCKKKSQRVCHFVAQQEISRPPHTLPIKVTSYWRAASVEPSF